MQDGGRVALHIPEHAIESATKQINSKLKFVPVRIWSIRIGNREQRERNNLTLNHYFNRLLIHVWHKFHTFQKCFMQRLNEKRRKNKIRLMTALHSLLQVHVTISNDFNVLYVGRKKAKNGSVWHTSCSVWKMEKNNEIFISTIKFINIYMYELYRRHSFINGRLFCFE